MSIKQFPSSTGDTGNNYHNDYTTTNAYVEIPFGFPAKTASFINDSNSDPAQISWDGVFLHHTLAAAEFKDMPANGRTSVYVKATAGGDNVRITAV